jgi:hypothetical protein
MKQATVLRPIAAAALFLLASCGPPPPPPPRPMPPPPPAMMPPPAPYVAPAPVPPPRVAVRHCPVGWHLVRGHYNPAHVWIRPHCVHN